MEGLVYKIAEQSASDPAEFILSDETIDRYGDVISVDGWDLRNFTKTRNPIALFNHHSDDVIGRWENVRVEGKRLLGRLVLADEGTSDLINKVRKLWKQGILRAVSVGFRALAKEKLTDDADEFWGPFRYLRQELVECSLVAVPANPNALQISRAFGDSRPPAEVTRMILGKPAREGQRAPAAVPRKPAPPLNPTRTQMKIADKIKAAQAEVTRLLDQLTTLSGKDDQTEDELALIDELPGEIEEARKELARHQRVEKALAVQMTEDDPDPDDATLRAQRALDNRRPFTVPAKKLQPVDLFFRAAAVAAMQRITQQPIEAVRAKLYGDDEATMWAVRAVTNPAQTGVPGWAQELVQTATAAFLNLLTPNTIFPTLRARGQSFTFGPGQGAIRVPGRAATPTLAGAWVGEGQPIPVRRLGLISSLLGPKKLAVISTFTHELADYSTPNIEAVIRDAMNTDTALVIDTYLLDAVAASTIRPAGLRNGVAGLTPSAATNPTEAMIADIKALVAAIIGVNGGSDIVIIMNTLQNMGINFAQSPAGFLFPTEGEAGRRFNVTFVNSTSVTPGTVIAVDANEFATASGDTPDFNVSDQATIHEEDTAPLAIGTAGTPAVVAAPVRSLWQTDTIGVRMRMPLNWTMRRAGMVSWMADVLW